MTSIENEYTHSKVKISSKALKIFLNHPVISCLLKVYGGSISGGLADVIRKQKSIIRYLCPMKNKVNDSITDRVGDVDVYFNSEKDYKEACAYIEDPNDNVYFVNDSQTGLCKNAYIQIWSNDGSELNDDWIIKDRFVKIQLVGAFFGKPEEFLDTFDFNNLKQCYYYKYNELFNCQSIKSKILKQSNLIDINHSNTPFLFFRLNKYLNFRGYKGITEDSHKHIQDWLIKASSGYFTKENTGFELFCDVLNNKRVKELMSRNDIIKDSDLILLLGKVKNSTLIQGNYKVFKHESDAVIDELKRRETVILNESSNTCQT
jgi:hypothetical protein